MGATKILRALNRRIQTGFVADETGREVQRTLKRSLYRQPGSLVIGALCGIAVSGVSASVVSDPLFCAMALILSVVAALRIGATMLLPGEGARLPRFYASIYEWGAVLYAGSFGTLAAIAIARNVGTGVEALLTTHAVGYAIAVCARNAGRPTMALALMLMVFVPLAAGCLVQGSPAYLLMAVTLPLIILAIMTVTGNLYAVLHDAAARAESSRRKAHDMEKLARTDVVTGLANRAGLNHALVEASMYIEEGQSMALFWLDLDRFKEVNDLLGHQTGDLVLAETAQRLRAIADRHRRSGLHG